jgi:hypothetical protein
MMRCVAEKRYFRKIKKALFCAIVSLNKNPAKKELFMNLQQNLSHIKSFFDTLPLKKDFRNKIDSKTFLIELVFALSEIGAGDRFSLSFLSSKMGHVGKFFFYSRSGFWRKMASESLTKILEIALEAWMQYFSKALALPPDFLKKLGVKEIFALDSTTLTLPEEAQADYPGVKRKGGEAAIKVHALLSITRGILAWFDLSSGKSHDSQHVPSVKMLAGSLLLMDLGYFDYSFFVELIEENVKFISRLKCNSILTIVAVVRGLGPNMIGKNHTDIARKRAGEVIEYLAALKGYTIRVIGHWDSEEKIYHWYLTNLECEAECIYPIYRVRSQIELLFKSLKGFMSFGEIPSANKTVIKNVILARLLSAMLVLSVGKAVIPDKLLREEKNAQKEVTIQRIFMFFSLFKNHLHKYFLMPTPEEGVCILHLCNIMPRKQKILISEPSLRRKNSMSRVKSLMEAA